jgi:hypothetical protein
MSLLVEDADAHVNSNFRLKRVPSEGFSPIFPSYFRENRRGVCLANVLLQDSHRVLLECDFADVFVHSPSSDAQRFKDSLPPPSHSIKCAMSLS